MKNIRRILVVMLLVLASAVGFAACGNPYKNLKLSIDDSTQGAGDALSRVFEYKEDSEENEFKITARVTGAGKNVSTAVNFTIQDASFITAVDDGETVDGELTSKKFRLTGTGETYITVTTVEGNLKADIKIVSNANATDLKFAENKVENENHIPVVKGQKLDLTKIMDGFSKPLLTFTPTYANIKNISIKVKGTKSSTSNKFEDIPDGSGIVIDGNTVLFDSENTYYTTYKKLQLEALLVGTNKTATTFVDVLDPIDLSTIDMSYRNETDGYGGEIEYTNLEVEDRAKNVFVAYLADYNSSDTNYKNRNIAFTKTKTTTTGVGAGAVTTTKISAVNDFLITVVDPKNTYARIQKEVAEGTEDSYFKISSIENEVGDIETYVFNLNYKNFSQFFTGAQVTLKVKITAFPKSVVLTTSSTDTQPKNEINWLVFRNYQDMVGTPFYVRVLSGDGVVIPNQQVYIGVRCVSTNGGVSYNQVNETSDAPKGLFLIRDKNNNIIEPGVTKVDSYGDGSVLYVRYTGNSIDEKNVYVLYAYSVFDNNVTSLTFKDTQGDPNASKYDNIVKVINDVDLKDDDLLITVGGTDEACLDLPNKIPDDKYRITVADAGMVEVFVSEKVENENTSKLSVRRKAGSARTGETEIEIVAPNGVCVTRKVFVTPAYTTDTNFALRVGKNLINSGDKIFFDMSVNTRLSIYLIINGQEYSSLPPKYSMSVQSSEEKLNSTMTINGWKEIRSLSTPRGSGSDHYTFTLSYEDDKKTIVFEFTIRVYKPIRSLTPNYANVTLTSNDIKPLANQIDTAQTMDISKKSSVVLEYFPNPDDATIEVYELSGELNLDVSVFSIYFNGETKKLFGKSDAIIQSIYDYDGDWESVEYVVNSSTLKFNWKASRVAYGENEDKYKIVLELANVSIESDRANLFRVYFDYHQKGSKIVYYVRENNGVKYLAYNSNGARVDFEHKFNDAGTEVTINGTNYTVENGLVEVESTVVVSTATRINLQKPNKVASVDISGLGNDKTISFNDNQITEGENLFSFGFNTVAVDQSKYLEKSGVIVGGFNGGKATQTEAVENDGYGEPANYHLSQFRYETYEVSSSFDDYSLTAPYYMYKDENGEYYLLDNNWQRVAKERYTVTPDIIYAGQINVKLDNLPYSNVQLYAGAATSASINAPVTEVHGKKVGEFVIEKGRATGVYLDEQLYEINNNVLYYAFNGVTSSDKWTNISGLSFEINNTANRVIFKLENAVKFRKYMEKFGYSHTFTLISCDSAAEGTPKMAKFTIKLNTGSKENPYTISTKEEFNNVRLAKSSSTYYKLLNNIYLSEYNEWVPFGNSASPFSAHIDGNNFSIMDFNGTCLPSMSSNTLYYGLFGYMSADANDVLLENITFKNINFKINIKDFKNADGDAFAPYSNGSVYIGTIAGYITEKVQLQNITLIDDIVYSGDYANRVKEVMSTNNLNRGLTVNIGKYTNMDMYCSDLAIYIGGFVGMLGSTNTNLTNIKTYITITVNDDNVENANNTVYVGGYTGSTLENVIVSPDGINVLIRNTNNNEKSAVGGVVGWLKGAVKNVNDVVCYINSSSNSVGGVAGHLEVQNNKLDSVINNVSVVPFIYGANNIGGVVGLYSEVAGIGENIDATISNVKVKFVERDATYANFHNSSIIGTNNVGGVIGKVESVNKNLTISYASVFSYVQYETEENGRITTKLDTTDYKEEVNDAPNWKFYGDIISKGTASSIGGFIGEANKAAIITVSSTYLNAIMVNTNTSTELNASANIGGVIGKLQAKDYAISNTTLTGKVINKASDKVGNFVGLISVTDEYLVNAGKYKELKLTSINEEKANIYNSYSILKTTDGNYISNFVADTAVSGAAEKDTDTNTDKYLIPLGSQTFSGDFYLNGSNTTIHGDGSLINGELNRLTVSVVLAYNSFYIGFITDVFYGSATDEHVEHEFTEVGLKDSMGLGSNRTQKVDISGKQYYATELETGKYFNYFVNYGYSNYVQPLIIINSSWSPEGTPITSLQSTEYPTAAKTNTSTYVYIGDEEGILNEGKPLKQSVNYNYEINDFGVIWTQGATSVTDEYLLKILNKILLQQRPDLAVGTGTVILYKTLNDYIKYQNWGLLEGNAIALRSLGSEEEAENPSFVADIMPNNFVVEATENYRASEADKNVVVVYYQKDKNTFNQSELFTVKADPVLASNEYYAVSGNTNVVVVNSDGTLTLKSEGSAEITIKSTLNSKIEKKILLLSIPINKNGLNWSLIDADSNKPYPEDINGNAIIEVIANYGTLLTTNFTSSGRLSFGVEYTIDLDSVSSNDRDAFLANFMLDGKKIPEGKYNEKSYTFSCVGLQHSLHDRVLGSVKIGQKLYFTYKVDDKEHKCYIKSLKDGLDISLATESKTLRVSFVEGVFGINGSNDLSFLVVNKENFFITLNCDSDKFDLALNAKLGEDEANIGTLILGEEVCLKDYNLGYLIIRLESVTFANNLKTFNFSAYLDDEGQKNMNGDLSYVLTFTAKLNDVLKGYSHSVNIDLQQQTVDYVNITHFTNILYTVNPVPDNGDPYKYPSDIIIPGYTSLLQIDFFPSFGYFDYIEVTSSSDLVNISQVIEAKNFYNIAEADVRKEYSWFEAYSTNVVFISNGIRISNKYGEHDYNKVGSNQYGYDGVMFVALFADQKLADQTVTITVKGYKNGVASELFTKSTNLTIEARPGVVVKSDISEVVFGGIVPLELTVSYTTEAFKASLKAEGNNAELIGSLADIMLDNSGRYILKIRDTQSAYISYSHLMYNNLTLTITVNKNINGVLVSAERSINIRLVPFIVDGINLNVDGAEKDGSNYLVQYYQLYYLAVSINATYSQGYYNYLLVAEPSKSIATQIGALEAYIAENVRQYGIFKQGTSTSRRTLLDLYTSSYSGEFALNYNPTNKSTTIRFINPSVSDFIWAEFGLNYTSRGIEITSASLSGQLVPDYVFSDSITVTVDTSSADDHPEPITSISDLKNMRDGVSYILLRDLYLINWSPLDVNFKMLDGNGYTLTLISFASELTSGGESTNIGIFKSIPSSTTIKNLTIELFPINITSLNNLAYEGETPYTTRVYNELRNNIARNEFKDDTSTDLVIDLVKKGVSLSNVNFGVLAGENNGIITNCRVVNAAGATNRDGTLRKERNDSLNNVSDNQRIVVNYGDNFDSVTNTLASLDIYGKNRNIIINAVTEEETTAKNDNFGALVGYNTGYITNSAVENININSQEYIGGVVGFNTASGKISNSYASGGTIEHNSIKANGGVGGFAARNAGSIKYSYVYGVRGTNGDYDGLNACGKTDSGFISTTGYAGGFVLENTGTIGNCYANIYIKNAVASGGFAYKNEEAGSVIEYCYSLSPVKLNDSFTYPFVNKYKVSPSGQQNSQPIDGTVISCFYLYNSKLANRENDAASSLTAKDFSDYSAFAGYAFNSDYMKSSSQILDAVWFIPTGSIVEQTTTDIYFNKSYSARTGAPELVGANLRTISSRYLIQTESDEYAFTYNYVTKHYIGATSYNITLGSQLNPMLIDSAEKFNKSIVSDALASETKRFRFVSDITFTKGDEVSSTQSANFKGKMEGNGMAIKSLRLSTDNANIDNVVTKLGLFATISGRKIGDMQDFAVVKNLDIEIAQVNGININIVGVLVGETNNSRIYNINVSGDSVTVQGQNAVGGIIGRAYGDCDLVNLTSSVSVIANYKSKDQNNFNYNSKAIMEEETKNQGYGFDSVVGKSTLYDSSIDNVKNVSYAGGVVGIINIQKLDPLLADDAKLANLYSNFYRARRLYLKGTPTISGEVVGGISAYLSGISNISDSEVVVSEGMHLKSTRVTGGLIGHNDGEIKRCFVVNDNQTAIDAIIEKDYEKLDNATTDIVLGTNTLYGDADTAYKATFVGGLVGLFKSGEIYNSYNRVNVVSYNSLYAGGLVGYITGNTTIKNCYTTASVQSFFSFGGLFGVAGNNNESYFFTNLSASGKVSMSQVVAANIWQYSHLNTSRMSSVSPNAANATVGMLVGTLRFNASDIFDTESAKYLQNRAKTDMVYYKQTYTYDTVKNPDGTIKHLLREIGKQKYINAEKSIATKIDVEYSLIANNVKAAYNSRYDSYWLGTAVTSGDYYYKSESYGLVSGLYRNSRTLQVDETKKPTGTEGTAYADDDSDKIYVYSRMADYGSLRSLKEIMDRRSETEEANKLYKSIDVAYNTQRDSEATMANRVRSLEAGNENKLSFTIGGVESDVVKADDTTIKVGGKTYALASGTFPQPTAIKVYDGWNEKNWYGVGVNLNTTTKSDNNVFPSIKNSLDVYSDVYVYNENDLEKVTANPSGTFILMNDIYLSERNGNFCSDLKPFKGTLRSARVGDTDGINSVAKNYTFTIFNLNYTASADDVKSNTAIGGLFAAVDGAVFENFNVHVKGLTVDASIEGAKTVAVGVLAGRATGATSIKNVQIIGNTNNVDTPQKVTDSNWRTTGLANNTFTTSYVEYALSVSEYKKGGTSVFNGGSNAVIKTDNVEFVGGYFGVAADYTITAQDGKETKYSGQATIINESGTQIDDIIGTGTEYIVRTTGLNSYVGKNMVGTLEFNAKYGGTTQKAGDTPQMILNVGGYFGMVNLRTSNNEKYTAGLEVKSLLISASITSNNPKVKYGFDEKYVTSDVNLGLIAGEVKTTEKITIDTLDTAKGLAPKISLTVSDTSNSYLLNSVNIGAFGKTTNANIAIKNEAKLKLDVYRRNYGKLTNNGKDSVNEYVGALAGQLDDGIILENGATCSFGTDYGASGDGKQSIENLYLGAFAGENHTELKNITITNSRINFSGTIDYGAAGGVVSGLEFAANSIYIGGAIGINYADIGTSDEKGIVLKNATIEINLTDIDSLCVVGGLIGALENNALLYRSAAAGKIEGMDHVRGNIGGLVGCQNGTIRESASYIDINCKLYYTVCVGGISGYNNCGYSIWDSVNYGNISCLYADDLGMKRIGGIVGDLFGGRIENCVSTGFIALKGDSVENSKNVYKKLIASSCNIGGLAGYTYSTTVENSYYNTEVVMGHNDIGTPKTTAELLNNTINLDGLKDNDAYYNLSTGFPKLKWLNDISFDYKNKAGLHHNLENNNTVKLNGNTSCSNDTTIENSTIYGQGYSIACPGNNLTFKNCNIVNLNLANINTLTLENCNIISVNINSGVGEISITNCVLIDCNINSDKVAIKDSFGLYNKTINSSGKIDFTNSLIVESKITAVTIGGEFVNSIVGGTYYIKGIGDSTDNKMEIINGSKAVNVQKVWYIKVDEKGIQVDLQMANKDHWYDTKMGLSKYWGENATTKAAVSETGGVKTYYVYTAEQLAWVSNEFAKQAEEFNAKHNIVIDARYGDKTYLDIEGNKHTYTYYQGSYWYQYVVEDITDASAKRYYKVNGSDNEFTTKTAYGTTEPSHTATTEYAGINMLGRLFTPISVIPNSFDGNGVPIINLHVVESGYAGLFASDGEINNARTIKNLYIKDSYFYGRYAAAVVGYSKNAQLTMQNIALENISINSNIMATYEGVMAVLLASSDLNITNFYATVKESSKNNILNIGGNIGGNKNAQLGYVARISSDGKFADDTYLLSTPSNINTDVVVITSGDLIRYQNNSIHDINAKFSVSDWKTTGKNADDTNNLSNNFGLPRLTFAKLTWIDDDVVEEVAPTGNTYTITTAAQLGWFAKQVNAGNSFEGDTVEIGANIDLNGRMWIPIGTLDNPFKGTFNGNGNGYTIKNIICEESTSTKAVGLFGVAQNAALNNVRIDYSKFIGSGDYLGAVVGYAKNTIINTVLLQCNTLESRALYTGMVAGCVECDTVVFNAKVSSENNIIVNGVSSTNDVGGVVGVITSGSQILGCDVNTTFNITSATTKSIGFVAGSVRPDIQFDGKYRKAILIQNNVVNGKVNGSLENVYLIYGRQWANGSDSGDNKIYIFETQLMVDNAKSYTNLIKSYDETQVFINNLFVKGIASLNDIYISTGTDLENVKGLWSDVAGAINDISFNTTAGTIDGITTVSANTTMRDFVNSKNFTSLSSQKIPGWVCEVEAANVDGVTINSLDGVTVYDEIIGISTKVITSQLAYAKFSRFRYENTKYYKTYGLTYKFSSDVTFSGDVTIGNEYFPFRHSVYGDSSHTITITDKEILQAGGLFANLQLENMKVSDIKVRLDLSDNFGINFALTNVGVIAGESNNVNFENCEVYLAKAISFENSGSLENFGIIVGKATDSNITSCKTSGYDVTSYKPINLGGIVGQLYLSEKEYNKNTTWNNVVNCENNVALNIFADSSDDLNGTAVGGIAGLADVYCLSGNKYSNGSSNAFNNFYGNKNTKNIYSGLDYAGGIVGKAFKTNIGLWSKGLGNTNTGNITGLKCVGGIVGYVYDYYFIYNNVNSGTVTSTGENNNSYVSGIVGFLSHNVDKKYVKVGENFTDTTSPDNARFKTIKGDSITVLSNTNNGQVNGLNYTGGVIGYLQGALFTKDNCTGLGNAYLTTIRDNKNTANINGRFYVGGILGYSYANRFIIYGNTVSGASADNKIKLSGVSCVSGIVGYFNIGSLSYGSNRIRMCDDVVRSVDKVQNVDLYGFNYVYSHFYVNGLNNAIMQAANDKDEWISNVMAYSIALHNSDIYSNIIGRTRTGNIGLNRTYVHGVYSGLTINNSFIYDDSYMYTIAKVNDGVFTLRGYNKETYDKWKNVIACEKKLEIRDLTCDTKGKRTLVNIYIDNVKKDLTSIGDKGDDSAIIIPLINKAQWKNLVYFPKYMLTVYITPRGVYYDGNVISNKYSISPVSGWSQIEASYNGSVILLTFSIYEKILSGNYNSFYIVEMFNYQSF